MTTEALNSTHQNLWLIESYPEYDMNEFTQDRKKSSDLGKKTLEIRYIL